MFFIRFLAVASLLLASVPSMPAWAQQQENIVLLPLQVPAGLQSKRDVYAAAIQNALRDKFNVFYGPTVEDALNREMAKTDCTVESCVQNVAIEFNGEIVVDATIEQLDTTYVLSLKFLNVITGELEESILTTCSDCTEAQLFSFVREQSATASLDSRRGLTALLEESGVVPVESEQLGNVSVVSEQSGEQTEAKPADASNESEQNLTADKINEEYNKAVAAAEAVNEAAKKQAEDNFKRVEKASDDAFTALLRGESPIQPEPKQSQPKKIVTPNPPSVRKNASVDFAKEKEGSNWWIYGIGALALAGGGGGGGGGGGETAASPTPSPIPDPTPSPTPDPTPEPLQQLEGDVVKGPLQGATVFLDYNDNGELDTGEPFTLTDTNGSYSFLVANANAPIVVVTDENTVDTSSGEVMSGLVLKAPQGSTVITPVTTLFADGEMTEAEVKASLGIEAEVDIKTFNPFKAETGSQVAVKLEKLALQIVSSANAISKVAQDEGVDQFEASRRAFASIIDSIEEKVEDGEQFDFTVQDDLDDIRAKAETELSEVISFNSDKRTALRGAMQTAKSTIETIDNLTSLAGESAKNIFRTAATIGVSIEQKKIADSDNDGIPDFIDFDRDNDGIDDGLDFYPDDPDRYNEEVRVVDVEDDEAIDEEEVIDEDAVAEPDADGDGVADAKDALPENFYEWKDTDGDGVGDNRDLFPELARAVADRDGDGRPDIDDEEYTYIYAAYLRQNSGSYEGLDASDVANGAEFPYVTDEGPEIWLEPNPDIGQQKIVNLHKLFPGDVFDINDALFNAYGGDSIRLYYDAADDYFGKTILLEGWLRDQDGNLLNNEVHSYIGQPEMERLVFGALRYDRSDFYDANGTVSIAYFNGEAASEAAFSTSREDAVFRGLSVGHIYDGDEGHTTSDISVSVDFANAAFDLTSDNTRVDRSVGGEITQDLSEFDFSVEGRFGGNFNRRLVADSIDAQGFNLISFDGSLFSISGDQLGGSWYITRNGGHYVASFGAYNHSTMPRLAQMTSEQDDGGIYAINSSFYNGAIEDMHVRYGGETQIRLTHSEFGPRMHSLEDGALFGQFNSNPGDVVDFNWANAPNIKRLYNKRYPENPEIALAHIINQEDEILSDINYLTFGVARFKGPLNNIEVQKSLAFSFGSETAQADRLQSAANFSGSSVGVYMGDNLPNGQDYYYTKSEIDLFVDFARDSSARGSLSEVEFRSTQSQRSNCMEGCGFSGFATIDFSADGEITDDGQLIITEIENEQIRSNDQFTIDIFGDDGATIGGTWHFKEMGTNHPVYSGSSGALREYIAAFGTIIDDPSRVDRDGDGVVDEDDAFPSDANESSDVDGDGIGDNADTDRDGDGVANGSDAFPNDANETADLDGDGTGDNADTDRDGDGVANASDAFPNDANETRDTDGDGRGDNEDVFDNDATEWANSDGDSFGDNSDPYPSQTLVPLGSATSFTGGTLAADTRYRLANTENRTNGSVYQIEINTSGELSQYNQSAFAQNGHVDLDFQINADSEMEYLRLESPHPDNKFSVAGLPSVMTFDANRAVVDKSILNWFSSAGNTNISHSYWVNAENNEAVNQAELFTNNLYASDGSQFMSDAIFGVFKHEGYAFAFHDGRRTLGIDGVGSLPTDSYSSRYKLTGFSTGQYFDAAQHDRWQPTISDIEVYIYPDMSFAKVLSTDTRMGSLNAQTGLPSETESDWQSVSLNFELEKFMLSGGLVSDMSGSRNEVKFTDSDTEFDSARFADWSLEIYGDDADEVAGSWGFKQDGPSGSEDEGKAYIGAFGGAEKTSVHTGYAGNANTSIAGMTGANTCCTSVGKSGDMYRQMARINASGYTDKITIRSNADVANSALFSHDAPQGENGTQRIELALEPGSGVAYQSAFDKGAGDDVAVAVNSAPNLFTFFESSSDPDVPAFHSFKNIIGDEAVLGRFNSAFLQYTVFGMADLKSRDRQWEGRDLDRTLSAFAVGDRLENASRAGRESFEGFSIGQHYSDGSISSREWTMSEVRVDIDWSAAPDEAMFYSENTYSASEINGDWSRATNLDFSVELARDNSSSTLSQSGDMDKFNSSNTSFMNYNINARFHGSGSTNVEEIGGSWMIYGDPSGGLQPGPSGFVYYTGAFGAKRTCSGNQCFGGPQ